MFFQLIFLTLALSVDSLSIGISYGIRKISLHPISIIIISAISLIFSSISILIGNVITSFLSEEITMYISISILFLMGSFIIINTLKDKKEDTKKKSSALSIFLNTMKKPETCDIDNSLKIEPLEAIFLGTALSIDSIGVSFAVSSINSYAFLFPIFIMLFQLIFLSLGIFFGKYLNYKNSNEKIWATLSGFILISISVFRLISKF